MEAEMNMESTFGSLLIGAFFSAGLFGVTCAQIFFYFQNYGSDGYVIKTSVLLLLFMEALHSAFTLQSVYYYTIVSHSSPSLLIRVTWSLVMVEGVTSGILLIVHLFYIRRLYHLSRKNIPLVGILAALALANFGASVAVTAQVFQIKTFFEFSRFMPLIEACLALAVATDVLTAGSLTFYLQTSKHGVQKTNTLINKLMVYAINNCILTSMISIIVLVLVITDPDMKNLYFWAIYQIIGNLYTNSMLATLNARKALRHGNGRLNSINNSYIHQLRFLADVGTTMGSVAVARELEGELEPGVVDNTVGKSKDDSNKTTTV